jgi:hypothetical protein
MPSSKNWIVLGWFTRQFRNALKNLELAAQRVYKTVDIDLHLIFLGEVCLA